MTFSGILNIQRNGRMIIPRASRGALVIDLPELGCRLLTTAGVASNATYVTVPRILRDDLKLPCTSAVVIRSAVSGPSEPTFTVEA